MNNMERISVRNLVEFILRSGDIESGTGGTKDITAMQEGSRIHKLIQANSGKYYTPEVSLNTIAEGTYDGQSVDIMIEGRADGIIDDGKSVVINEIKTMYMDVTRLQSPVPMHRNQAMCYVAMYFMQKDTDDINEIGMKITYCQITDATRYNELVIKEFEETIRREEAMQWFERLINEYAKWVIWSNNRRIIRDDSVKKMTFPYEYRNGQFDLVKGVYITILRKKKLFLQAPTGVGKTLSTIFPVVTGLGEGIVEKIFYLTAKTITRTVAEESVALLAAGGVRLKSVTITAKEKICILGKPDCNPNACERAKGHYDRVNDAVYDMLTHEENVSRDIINKYAEKHMVCPFEMCLDVTTWSDIIICDYNYVFDPKVCLKRFFSEGEKRDYVFLVDEAHNLVDRAKKMYSAVLCKELVMDVKRSIKTYHNTLYKALDRLNECMLGYKRACDEFEVVDSVSDVTFQLMRVLVPYEEFLKDVLPSLRDFTNTDNLLQLYYDIRFFINIYGLMDDKYRIYTNYNEQNEFCITLQCMNPSANLKDYLCKGRSAVFFSATLLPVRYYMAQYGSGEDDYAVYAESSFDSSNQLILIANDVSAKYTRRNENEFRHMAEYIELFAGAKKGNYIAFFPSYKMMYDVLGFMSDTYECVVQQPGMNEEDREEFLGLFKEGNDGTLIGFCVMGGIFGEGIDLRDDMLIGVIIVGTGLPMVGHERELCKSYYDGECGKGFEYAYLYPGMNKVLQAAGRVIRTATDRGCILLLDERFAQNQYRALFPREWKNVFYVNKINFMKILSAFWQKQR